MSETRKPATCWSCGRPATARYFCEGCGAVQPPSGNYFEYLGLPSKLQIDLVELEKRFYELSWRLHPDTYFQRPEPERLLAEEASARLNDAYRTLQDPVARVEYLLELHGINKREQSASPALLEEVFEWKSSLEGDNSSASAASRLATMLEETDRSLDREFAVWDRTGDRAALERIAGILNQRSYIAKVLSDFQGCGASSPAGEPAS